MSQQLNFGAFKVQKSANERASQAGVARGQNFKLKFRKFNAKKGGEIKLDTVFTMSNEKFNELNLAEYGIIQLNAPEGTEGGYIAVVSNDDATMLKRTDKLAPDAPKGKKFKSTILEKALVTAGVIDDTLEGTSQFLDLVKVADTTDLGGLTAIAIYQIVKGEGSDDEDEVENTNADNSEAPVSEGTNMGSHVSEQENEEF